DVDGPVEGKRVKSKPATVPDERDKEDGSRQKLFRAGDEGVLMRGNLRRQLPYGSGNDIGEKNDCEKRSRNFALRMARTGQKPLDQKRYHQKERENQAAEPQGYRSPMKFENGLRGQLEEKEA